jgi:hypothetical protein
MASTVVGAKFRITSPPGAERDVVAKDAPALVDLYDEVQGNGADLLFYTPTHPAWGEVRPYWSYVGDDKVQIQAFVRPKTEAAVQAVVRYLVKHEIPLGVRAGGLSLTGQSRAEEGGVVIDMRAMDGVAILEEPAAGERSDDGAYKVAAVGGGITTSTVSHSLAEAGLTTPTAWSGAVGYPGWILGGGYSYQSSRLGLGVDNLVGARVVLASGEVVDTADDKTGELLFALRGAGNGNLGVVTELRVKAHPAAEVLAGVIAFPLAELKSVMSKFRERAAAEGGVPNSFTGESMSFCPPGGGIPLFGFHFVWALQKDKADLEECQKWREIIRSLGNLVMDTVTEGELRAMLPVTKASFNRKNRC